MIAYKLLRVRKNNTIGPLFINKKQIVPIGEWLNAELHPTKKFQVRKGWHVMDKPTAPHLSIKGRAWFLVDIEDFEVIKRPESQGGKWYLANRMKVIKQYFGKSINYEKN
jgi:hypothetical protein